MELQSTYKRNDKKIIFTEEVYARLLGMINITEFKSSNFSKAFNKKNISLGGMMSNSSSKMPSDNVINFVYYNELENKMEYLPNMFVIIDNKLIPLTQSTEKIYFDSTNRIYNDGLLEQGKEYSSFDIYRTHMEIKEDTSNKSR